MPQVPKLLILHDATLRIDDDVQNTREGHHILDNAPHGRRDGPGALDGVEKLGRRAEVEAARVAGGVERSVAGVLDDSSLEVREAVRVQGAAHLGRVADDLALVARANVGGGVADLAVGEAEGGEVGLGVGLPPCRKTIMKDEEVERVRRARESCRAGRDDVVHDLVLGRGIGSLG